MYLLRRTLVPFLILVFPPLAARSQGPIAPPPSPAESVLAYQNSPDGLRQQLQDILAVAREHNASKLESLIKQMEIPNSEDWFTKTYGEEIGERLAGAYGRNLANGETDLESLFTQLASEDGEFTVRRVLDALASRRTSEGEPPAPKVWRGPADPFIVTWKNRGLSASPRVRPIGPFVYLDGSFRLAAMFRSPAPGRSTYPNLSGEAPHGLAAETSDIPSGWGNDQGTYRTGVGGVGYPICTYCPDPEYTKEARAKHLEGIVILQVIVQPDGQATDIQVVKTIDPGLAQKAIEAVSRWRFNPARRADGEPVPVVVPIEVNFRLLK
jgi:TonB family protein